MKFVKHLLNNIKKSTEQPLHMYIEQEIKEIKDEVYNLRKELTLIKESLFKNRAITFISTNEAASLLGMKRNTLLDQIRKGKIKAIRTCPGNPSSRYKVSEEEVYRILEMRG